MINDLSNLIKLQEIDGRVHQLELSKKEYPQEVERLEQEIAIADQTLTTIKEKLEKVTTESKKVIEQINDAKLQLEKSEELLSTIATNREYDAVHNQIAAQKEIIKKNQALEGRLLSNKNELESSLIETEEQLSKIKTENEPKIKDLSTKINSIDSDIAKVVAEREKVIPEILPRFFRTYEHIHKNRKNKSVVSLVNDAGNCSVCYKMLEPQLINEVRKMNNLHICESCGSLLIWNKTEE